MGTLAKGGCACGRAGGGLDTERGTSENVVICGGKGGAETPCAWLVGREVDGTPGTWLWGKEVDGTPGTRMRGAEEGGAEACDMGTTFWGAYIMGGAFTFWSIFSSLASMTACAEVDL